MTAIIRRDWTKAEKTFSHAHTGYKSDRLPGGYIYDLVALQKCVILCPSCSPKFDSTKNGYVIPRNIPRTSGRCDGCKNFHHMNTMFMHHEQLPR